MALNTRQIEPSLSEKSLSSDQETRVSGSRKKGAYKSWQRGCCSFSWYLLDIESICVAEATKKLNPLLLPIFSGATLILISIRNVHAYLHRAGCLYACRPETHR
jgi:hypothetical protein